mmetsp:Transcript_4797/g.15969  ORF Transcript_4797/g.15969 Transcript_4797/m.15969 type:complete len:340 (-) Transcript_4797:563-1582(-)
MRPRHSAAQPADVQACAPPSSPAWPHRAGTGAQRSWPSDSDSDSDSALPAPPESAALEGPAPPLPLLALYSSILASYCSLSLAACSSNLALSSAVADRHRSPSALPTSGTDICGCAAIICGRSSLEKSRKAVMGRLGASGSFFARFFLPGLPCLPLPLAGASPPSSASSSSSSASAAFLPFLPFLRLEPAASSSSEQSSSSNSSSTSESSPPAKSSSSSSSLSASSSSSSSSSSASASSRPRPRPAPSSSPRSPPLWMFLMRSFLEMRKLKRGWYSLRCMLPSCIWSPPRLCRIMSNILDEAPAEDLSTRLNSTAAIESKGTSWGGLVLTKKARSKAKR